jgi:hypothetical protein
MQLRASNNIEKQELCTDGSTGADRQYNKYFEGGGYIPDDFIRKASFVCLWHLPDVSLYKTCRKSSNHNYMTRRWQEMGHYFQWRRNLLLILSKSVIFMQTILLDVSLR